MPVGCAKYVIADSAQPSKKGGPVEAHIHAGNFWNTSEPRSSRTPRAGVAAASTSGRFSRGQYRERKETIQGARLHQLSQLFGSGGAGARLAQNPITFQAFVNYVRKPKGTMPPFGNQVTQTELADIYAFLKSVPPSPDPKTIPLLNQID